MTQYYTAQDLAARYSVSLRWIRTIQALGKLPAPIQVGNSQRWTDAMLAEFDKQRGVEAMETTADKQPKYYTAQAFADRYRVTLRTIRTLKAQGKLPEPIQVGSQKRWTDAMLAKYDKQRGAR